MAFDYGKFVLEIYGEAHSEREIDNGNSINKRLSFHANNCLDIVAEYCYKRKAVTTVLITLLTYKIKNESQDVRYHQQQLAEGFSGRTIDTAYITPALKKITMDGKHIFPYMVESGWLTRSLEQPEPYNLSYPGKISPEKLKKAFLQILNDINEKGKNPKDYLLALFCRIILQMDHILSSIKKIPSLVASEVEPSINIIISALQKHFYYSYTDHTHGAARLPVLAIAAIYECLMKEINRYHNKTMEIGRHTGPDKHAAGDIDILDGEDNIVESVEVKHGPGKEISLQLVTDIVERKIKNNPQIKRYYALSTSGIKKDEIFKTALHKDDWVKFVIQDHKDFVKAVSVIHWLFPDHANVAFSPVLNMFSCRQLMGLMGEYNILYPVVSVQLHKLVNME